MNKDDVFFRSIRGWSLASVCFPLSVLVLGVVVVLLVFSDVSQVFFVYSFYVFFFLSAILLPAGLISGHIALRRIGANPETAGNYKRLAVLGIVIGFSLAALVAFGAWFLFSGLPMMVRN